MNKGKKTGIIIMLMGVLLISAALGLSFYNIYSQSEAEKLSADVLSKLGDSDEITQNEHIPDYILNPEMDMPRKKIDDKYYVGTLSIPALDLKLPVIENWSYENFKIAPCVYQGTPYKGKFIIAAHNYRKHFGALKNLKSKSPVTFKDMDGNVFKYEVMYVEVLDNNAVEEMSQGSGDLTLFTCTYGGATRITVRCKAVE